MSFNQLPNIAVFWGAIGGHVDVEENAVQFFQVKASH